MATSFCAKTREFKPQLKEIFVYVGGNGKNLIEKYEGINHETSDVCEHNLISIKKKFSSMGMTNIYGFCSKIRKDMFKPILHFIK